MTPSRTKPVCFARVAFTRLLPAAPLALAGTASAIPIGPVEWPLAEGGNGHFYEYVWSAGSPSITWDGARDAASARSFAGAGGHLATVTSEQEQQFLVTHLSLATGAGPDAWIGGIQAPGIASPRQGWTWITGEEWDYTAWLPNEPNDWFGDERYLSAAGTGGPQMWRWNDNYVNGVPVAYLVEYEVAPEPTSAALMGVAAASLLFRRRRH